MLRRSLRMFKDSQYIYVTRRLKLHTSIPPVLFARSDKDLPNPHVPTPVSKLYGHDTDILFEQLKSCKSLDRNLELINMHLDVMNTKHIVICLENMHSFVKNDQVISQSLIENPIFTSLCSRLMKVIRLFEPEEVITCYKLLCVLQIRSNTYIMQCVLKMLGAHLNNMTLGQLTFLNFLLHKQRHNPLVDGLRLALPLVLQVQIDQQIDSDNLKDVVNCLQLACRSRLKSTVIQKIVNAITEKIPDLATDDALTVAFALLSVDTPIDGYKELLDSALEVISRNISEVNDKKLITLIKTCRSQRVYHFTLFITLAERIVSQKWNLALTYSTMSNFHGLEFSPSNLIDHFADVLCSESKEYQSDHFYSPLNCIEYLTGTSYHPANIDGAARVIYSDESKLENLRTKFPHLYVKFLSCLAMIGHFPPNFLSSLLHEDFLFNAWHISKKLGRASQFEKCVLSLLWSLKLYDEADNFTIPSSVLNKVINGVYQKHVDSEYPLAKFIENGLGGSQFLQTGVFSEDGHVIDHIVAMRSGNYPVSIQNMKPKERKEITLQKKIFVEDLILPEDAKIIAIIVAKEECYFRDPEILKGWEDLKVRSLGKKNYAVVVINFSLWKNLPDREKIPYLMREIKEVAPDGITLRSKFS